ncbi:MAG: hypothetical protein ACKO15_01725, partial [Burkholderiales bacterium]
MASNENGKQRVVIALVQDVAANEEIVTPHQAGYAIATRPRHYPLLSQGTLPAFRTTHQSAARSRTQYAAHRWKQM